jgi:uncharacterized protein (TIGR00730 family)
MTRAGGCDSFAGVRSVCVYLSSSAGRPADIEAIQALGRELAARDLTLIYGGAHRGLMGVLADATLGAGGRAIGVIPQALVDREIAHTGLTELHVVDTMHQRKQAFTDLSDGFINLPGGTGTMDELWEALSWAQIGYHAKPVGLLNVAGYYDHLIAFYARMGEVGFLRPQHQGVLTVDDTLEGLLAKMAAHVPIETITKMRAKDL